MGIQDGGGEPPAQSHGEEDPVEHLAAGQSEGDVGDPQGGVAAQFPPDALQGLQGDLPRLRGGGDGHGQGVEDQVLPGNAVFGGLLHDAPGDGHPSLGVPGNPLLVQGQGHHHAAILAHQGEDRLHDLLLAVDGVDHGLAVVEAHGPFHSHGIGGVDLEGKGQDGLQFADSLGQQGGFVNLREPHVHIQEMGAHLLLPASPVEDISHVPFQQGLLEALLPGGVDALPNQHGTLFEGDRRRIGGDHGLLLGGHEHGGKGAAGLRQGADVLRSRAAAPPRQAHAPGDHP